MYEKVTPSHPDKIADRIGGAIVDLAYEKSKNPKVAGEVLIGHGESSIIIESDLNFDILEVTPIVKRIAGIDNVNLKVVKQDKHLADNQEGEIKCGDNGIFKGALMTAEQYKLAHIVKDIYATYPYDGKYILNGRNLICCQSHVQSDVFRDLIQRKCPELNVRVNPLGDWTGGIDVDCGCTNRKLGSDMGDSVTGGGLHFKDLSKADVSVNIYAWLKAQRGGKPVELTCAIGDTIVDGKHYHEIVEVARQFIKSVGGFEKFAEWGLI